MKGTCCAPMTRLSSKGAVLVIVWTYFVCDAFFTITDHAVTLPYPLAQSCVVGLIALLGPFAGLISSIYFGRYRSLSGSFWLMLGANLCIVALLVLQDFVAGSQKLVFNIGLFLALVVFSIGVAVSFVNLIPFGVDQMPDASAEQIKAFVSRFVWSSMVGGVTVKLTNAIHCCAHLQFVESTTLQSLYSAVCLSVLLCSTFLCNRWLTVEPEDTSPLKHIYKVLEFAVKHKYPIRRTAFTYCENELPSCIDLAKSKYGGPFTSEEVENAKTFLRMSLVIAFIFVIVTPGISLWFSARWAFYYHFLPSDGAYICHNHLIHSGSFLVVVIALSPPILEGIIRQKLRRCVSHRLNCVGLAQTLTSLVALILLVMSIVWFMKPSSAEWPFRDKEFDIHYQWVEIPVDFLLICWVYITVVGLLEFVCAQAPYRQRGLLMGLMYSMLLISGGCAALFVFSYLTKVQSSASNGVWFCLVLTLSTIVGSLIWSCVAKRYKNRERDEPDRVRVYVEEVYDRYCRLQTP